MERDGWISLARWVRRRPDVEPGGRAFAYRGAVLPLMLVFTGVSALEIVALDLIVPWGSLTWLRIAVAAVGVWGLTFALGMLAGVTVHPHVVGEDGLRLRSGRAVDVVVPWTAIERARAARRTRDGAAVQVEGGVLHLPMASQTTAEITLREPVEVDLPRQGRVAVRAVHFHADDAAGLVTTLRLRSTAA